MLICARASLLAVPVPDVSLSKRAVGSPAIGWEDLEVLALVRVLGLKLSGGFDRQNQAGMSPSLGWPGRILCCRHDKPNTQKLAAPSAWCWRLTDNGRLGGENKKFELDSGLLAGAPID